MIAKLQQIRAAFRFHPFDTSTEAGRSQERYRRILLTSSASFLARGLNALIILVSVPLCKKYLGDERYGLWLTLLSIMAMLSFSDLGISNGMVSLIAQAYGRRDTLAASRYVTSGITVVFLIAMTLGAAYTIAYPWVSFARLFKISDPQTLLDVKHAFSALLACYLVNMVLGIVNNIQDGHQDGFRTQFWNIAGNVFGLIGLLLAVYFKANLTWLVLAASGLPLIPRAANAVVLFTIQRPYLRPRVSNFSVASAKEVMHSGLLFFALQAAVAIGFNSDNVIIAHYLDPSQVPQYGVPMRMFSLVIVVLNVFLTPLWPAYGEAAGRGDMAWVRRTLFRSWTVAISICAVPLVTLVFFGKPIVRLWIGDDSIVAAPSLLTAMAIWTFIALAVSQPLAMFYNGLRVVGTQVITTSIMAVVNVILSIWLVHKIGLPGPLWGSILSQSVCVLIPAIWIVPHVLRTREKLHSSPSVHTIESPNA